MDPAHKPRPFLAGLLAVLLLGLAAALLIALCAGPAAAGGPAAPPEHAIPLCVHLAGPEDGHPPLRAFLEAAVPRAQELLGPAGARFEVRGTRAGEPAERAVQNAAERDALAAHAGEAGCVHVFLLPRLGDLERKDLDIAGRHWRYQGKDRRLRGRRYVLVAPASARVDTLAHELGHYFGLGHRAERQNLMKQLPRDPAPGLTPAQLRVVSRTLRSFR
ncbi:MAG TPA: hypothetical protein PK668_09545 [Myxococcota bacterium]|nr:hypothetical protein [Myxococcota bacterium]HRY92774.1 hypothetical protein [Myxococcota bacterium]HSA20431.1 hypothetical protein [Myxococcota bacterium]